MSAAVSTQVGLAIAIGSFACIVAGTVGVLACYLADHWHDDEVDDFVEWEREWGEWVTECRRRSQRIHPSQWGQP